MNHKQCSDDDEHQEHMSEASLVAIVQRKSLNTPLVLSYRTEFPISLAKKICTRYLAAWI